MICSLSGDDPSTDMHPRQRPARPERELHAELTHSTKAANLINAMRRVAPHEIGINVARQPFEEWSGALSWL